MKKKILGVILVISLLSITLGCGSTPTQSTTSSTTTQSTQGESMKTGGSPLVFTGSGHDVVAFTATGSGLRIFSGQHSGTGNFMVWIKNEEGKLVGGAANCIGNCSGKMSQRLTPGKYYLDITANGPWRIEIEPSVEKTSAINGSPSVFTGSGHDVVAFTATGSGLRIFSGQHSGTGNFMVWIKNEEGKLVGGAANCIGNCSGKMSQRLTPGKYYLDITANGPWRIEIYS
ncbi:MAG TPA: hypothetical protein PKH80_06525 [Methanofastidiosum sp.]|nr:hypothetical protein [Methanofastidiosum sp.]HNU62117.1 hypothetical protein [Methanofastidiosum sp.]